MNKSIKISPSIMCCKLWEVREFIRAFEETGVDSIHFDVMDGHYVQNIMLGTPFYRNLKELTNIPIDIHLMCLEPERYLDYFNVAEGDRVSFHFETCKQPYKLLQQIRDRGLKAGLVFNPGTPIEILAEVKSVLDFVIVMAVNPGFQGQTMVPDHFDKLERIAALLKRCDIDADIFVDGNTTPEKSQKMYAAGANGFIVGTSSLLKDVKYFRDQYQNYIKNIKDTQK
jgi:ribulose-phosphate 3-epimerase